MNDRGRATRCWRIHADVRRVLAKSSHAGDTTSEWLKFGRAALSYSPRIPRTWFDYTPPQRGVANLVFGRGLRARRRHRRPLRSVSAAAACPPPPDVGVANLV